MPLDFFYRHRLSKNGQNGNGPSAVGVRINDEVVIEGSDFVAQLLEKILVQKIFADAGSGHNVLSARDSIFILFFL